MENYRKTFIHNNRVKKISSEPDAVTSPKIWGVKKLGGKMFDFKRITPFCLEKRLSKHKMTMFSKNLGVHGPFRPPWLRLGQMQSSKWATSGSRAIGSRPLV